MFMINTPMSVVHMYVSVVHMYIVSVVTLNVAVAYLHVQYVVHTHEQIMITQCDIFCYLIKFIEC